MVSLRTTVLFSENVQKLLALLKLGHLVHLLLDVGVAPPRLPTHRMTELCIPSIQSITNQFIFVLRQGYLLFCDTPTSLCFSEKILLSQWYTLPSTVNACDEVGSQLD